MEKIEINGKIIEYNLERKKIKNSYISIQDGIVTVKVPTKTPDTRIHELIEKRADWIIQNVECQKKSARFPKQYIDGEIFKVLGKEVVLNISYETIKKPKFKFSLGKFHVGLPMENQENSMPIILKLIDNFYQQLAEKEVERAMRKMTMQVGLAPNQYTIKKLKSTWGNCSTAGNISISRNVVMYSRHAIEYVCLHEICHLKNMNHSKDFWNMVATFMPDYKKAEQELKM